MARKTKVANETLAEMLDRMTRVGDLWRPEGDRIRCFACGHYCLIGEGLRGICKVRFNKDGKLYVPWGYVAALQNDPIEKKPFFHVLPGRQTLTFGMLGCDYKCPYCFPEDTPVFTADGVVPIGDIFERGKERLHLHDGEIAFPDIQVFTRHGELKPVRAAFRHFYRGELVRIHVPYLPPLRCTPDHRIFVKTQEGKVELIPAAQLTTEHFLLVPKQFASAQQTILDVAELLSGVQPAYRKSYVLSEEDVSTIMELSAQGVSSRKIGTLLEKDPSYIRHVRSKVQRGLWQRSGIQHIVRENGHVRFLKEHRPGIPAQIPVDERLATLLGYYCAEGCVTFSNKRPNSLTVHFSLGLHERPVAERIQALLEDVFGLSATCIQRKTTLAVSITKASLGWLFKILCGDRAAEKRVPAFLFTAPRSVVEAFVNAFVEGDGHRYENGKVSITTVSTSLAYGLAALVLRLGYLPSIYEDEQAPYGTIEDQVVQQASKLYTVVWYTGDIERKCVEDEHFYAIPIQRVEREPFEGYVYNLEVDDPDHTYLAGFFAVSNCQNWLTSQALRDPAAGVRPERITPEEMVALAKRLGSAMITSSYNEPLITAEWAVDIFKLAKAEGFKTAFVSNGNATREALEYLRPWTDCYKIDLKSMNDRNYRVLGGKLENVLKAIKMIYEMGFWLEIVTLVVPGFNDSEEELRAAAEYIASISPEIPWHVTAFHQDYKMTDPRNTTAQDLIRAAEIGREAGLHFVYAGNLPGMVGEYENTYCPDCRAPLIRRYGFWVLENRLGPDGLCPDCGRRIPGIWA